MFDIAARALLLVASYLLLVGQPQADEIGLAAGCGLLCLVWSLLLSRAGQGRFHFSWRAVRIFAQAVAGLPLGIARIAPALLWRRRGRIAHEALPLGPPDTVSSSERAAELLALSLAPDRYALRWAKRGRAAEIHRLVVERS